MTPETRARLIALVWNWDRIACQLEAVRDKIDEIIALRASPAPSEGLREAFIAGAWWHLMGCHGALTHEKAHDEAKRRYSDAALRQSAKEGA